ncbi:MAG: NAD-glutamate dehydrogenase [Alphaproteobacteria bacterium]
MSARHKELKAETIDRIAMLARSRIAGEEGAMVEAFVRRYYAGVHALDLVEQSEDDLYGAALAHWRLGRRREREAPVVRVYNPTLEAAGWHSDHTVIMMVNDDMPFLVDSTTGYLAAEGLEVHAIVHPIVGVARDADGMISRIGEVCTSGELKPESYIQFQVDLRSSPETLDKLAKGMERVLADVRAAVRDWRAMLGKMADTIAMIERSTLPVLEEDRQEAMAFLRWVSDNHFTFLGYREYAVTTDEDGAAQYEMDEASGLGIVRDPAVRPMGLETGHQGVPPEVADFIRAPNLLLVTKAGMRATVHRTVPMDVIGVKVFEPSGRVVGEHRFLGLFTSTAYSRSPRDIPLLRRKVHRVLERSGLQMNGHDYKALQHILEAYPRDELFQVDTDELLDIALGILEVEERRRVGVFVRHDPFGRFASVLVFVPRERYNTDIRMRIEKLLLDTFSGTQAGYAAQISDEPLARIHFQIDTPHGRVPPYDIAEIETRIGEIVRSWTDQLSAALIARHGEEAGTALFRQYGTSFPVGYADEFSPQLAVADIERIDHAWRTGHLETSLYRRPDDGEGRISFKIYRAGSPVPLSELLPPLENLGLKVLTERPHQIRFGVGEPAEPVSVWIHDLTMAVADGVEIKVTEMRDAFHEAFAQIWAGEAEDDGFNRLVLSARLSWREVVVLRMVSKYLRQTGIPFSHDYMAETLTRYPKLAGLLVRHFLARFDPARIAARDESSLRAEILGALDAVESVDDDRILRRFLNVIESALRTNYFQRGADGAPKPYVSIKLDSGALDELPLPRPLYEIFVYARRMEGIHLRGGKVARGGIRWSDRREDFRTEVLSLMKAQMVKNAVIVPVGAKGGFIVKRPPQEGGRDALMEEGIACYSMLIRGMLDLTDNRVKDDIVTPEAVVRHDDDDPYLVVAADKGTATFSDIANAISAEYGFWLGDAFASGGGTGYDHKKMGITARGAWESVKRHFRELGRDISRESFTCVGIGDMSGDVFGNGLLQSPTTKLIAAFNHRHIFIDPDPDPAASYEERKRLFELPRSNWTDYDRAKLSAGGGIFERNVKSIALSPEARQVLGIESTALAPNILIKALLRAQVDLLFFGGIGCFVKASTESHADANDRTNDAIRVDAKKLRALVVGEGANLGMTQRARIEYAMQGGALNTDAIDNSGGVDCSDHEVNIKILLDAMVAEGDMTEKQRNQLLAEMTDEVGTLVLRNNYQQTETITVEVARAAERMSAHARLIRGLERRGRLNREVEFLPAEDEIAARLQAKKGLTRPEIAVLLSYSKAVVYEALHEDPVLDDPYFADDLVRYFPARLKQPCAAMIPKHRLRREIIGTAIANSLVNRGGPHFLVDVAEETGTQPGDVVRAYAAARQVYALREEWDAIEALDNAIPATLQTDLLIEIGRLLQHGTLWFLRTRAPGFDIRSEIETFRPAVAELSANVDKVRANDEAEAQHTRAVAFEEAGVPAALAKRIAAVDSLLPACDIAEVAAAAGVPVLDAARLYFALGSRLSIEWLRDNASALADGSHWQYRAVRAIVDDLYGQQRALALAVLKNTDADAAPEERLSAWLEANRKRTGRALDTIEELRRDAPIDLAKLAVANRQVRALIVA